MHVLFRHQQWPPVEQASPTQHQCTGHSCTPGLNTHTCMPFSTLVTAAMGSLCPPVNISPTTVFHETVCLAAEKPAAWLPSPSTCRHNRLKVNHNIKQKHYPLAVSTRSVILNHILLQYKVQELFQLFVLIYIIGLRINFSVNKLWEITVF